LLLSLSFVNCAPQRFGIEGCEALLPGLEALVERCAARGVRRLEMGMPHRGRLNVRSLSATRDSARGF